MNKVFAITLLILTFAVMGLAQDARVIAKNIFPSVVLLEMQDSNNRPMSLGSGFFVRTDVVATNYHVIEGASYGFAKIVGESTTYRIEGTVGIDKSRDLALLKLIGAKGKPLTLADISQIETGQEVFALGNPRGLEGTISAGIISGINLREVDNEKLIQITAPISAGSSGGPVVNKQGEVIGVASASYTNGQNLNFAVPSSYLAILLANSRSASSLTGIAQDLTGIAQTPCTRYVGPDFSICQPAGWTADATQVAGFKTVSGTAPNGKLANLVFAEEPHSLKLSEYVDKTNEYTLTHVSELGFTSIKLFSRSAIVTDTNETGIKTVLLEELQGNKLVGVQYIFDTGKKKLLVTFTSFETERAANEKLFDETVKSLQIGH